MSGRLIGYARVSADVRDLTAQRHALARLGVATKRVHFDEGLLGTHLPRPGLLKAIAACRAGDTLVVTKLDRLARSLSDARDIAGQLAASGVKLSLGGTVHDPSDPVGRELFTVLALVAEFESDLARARTREGMAVAKAKGRLRGKQPKLNVDQETHLVGLWRAGAHTSVELAELFTVARSTVYRAIQRAAPAPGTAATSGVGPEPDSPRLVVPGPQDTSRAPDNARSNPAPVGSLTAAEQSDLGGRTGARAGANAAAPAGAAAIAATAVTRGTGDLAALAVGPTSEAPRPRRGDAATKPVRVAKKLGRWFLVEADVRDDQAPVVVLSRHTTERAAVAALGKAKRKHPTRSDDAVLQVRQAEQIVSRLEWDAHACKGVVLAGPPDAR